MRKNKPYRMTDYTILARNLLTEAERLEFTPRQLLALRYAVNISRKKDKELLATIARRHFLEVMFKLSAGDSMAIGRLYNIAIWKYKAEAVGGVLNG
jgi:hypothetical protein